MTSVERALIYGARAWRAVAGPNTTLERSIKRRYRRAMRREKHRGYVQYSNQYYLIIRSRRDPEPRTGIYLRGGCDLPTLFLMAPLVGSGMERGTVAIARPAEAVGSSQSAQLLDTLEGIPRELTEETCKRLQIRPSYFKPVLFEPTFEIEGFPEHGSFPKTVVVLSTGSDLTRSLHRHREHGYLVDIGGWWLNQSMEKAIRDLEAAQWFKRSFESVGRIPVEDFQHNFELIIKHLRDGLGSQVVVLNSLVVDPLNPTHNYQLLGRAHSVRRREFHLALNELSAKLDVHVLDVDALLKQHGVREQVDFAHFPLDGARPIAEEGYRIFKELGVL